jgi:hypothetical protein
MIRQRVELIAYEGFSPLVLGVEEDGGDPRVLGHA